jgi:diguanylate cyclase (GGDEF)-like protein
MSSVNAIVFWFVGGCLFAFLLLFPVLSQYKKRAYTDGLTGLKNANYLEDFFHKYMTRNTSYALLDIDNFKSFNTAFGYDSADGILRSFVRGVEAAFPDETKILRYRFGDEFLIIVKGKTSDDILMILKGLKKKFETMPVNSPGKNADIRICFSVGITSFREGDSKAMVMSRLLGALAKAKMEKDKAVVFL